MNNGNKYASNQELLDEILEFTHFIKTPLASIKIGGSILSEAIHPLVEAYKEYAQLNPQNGHLNNERTFDKLVSIINNLITEANRISEHTKHIEARLLEQKGNLQECND